MSRQALFLLISIRSKKKNHFKFTWPFPLLIILMFSDMLLDISSIAVIFTRREKTSPAEYLPKGKKYPLRTIYTWTHAIHLILKEGLRISEPWELLSVETEDIHIRLKMI